ncbi:unnamed protein product, partial [Heterotrigona itama]
MCCFIRNNVFFYLLIYSVNFIQIILGKELFEFSQPSKCKNNEYFDTISLSCILCDPDKNLKPSVDRLRCICDDFSKKIDFKNGYPVCVFCGINTTVTSDGNDCVPCNNTLCKCASNEIQVDRSLDGTLLDAMYCIPCPNNTYPFLDGSKCLPCKNFEYNYYENDIYLTKYHYIQIQNYCLHKNIYFDKENPKTAFQVKFKNKNIDSYYFRNELQTAIYFCKKKDKLACEHLSNICVLSIYANDIACKFFMQKQKSPIWLFYNKNDTKTVLNSKQITQNYSLMKNNNDNILNFTVTTFSLHGYFKSIGTPNIPCNLLEHVNFGINFEKKCKITVKNLAQTKIEFMSPYLTFTENNISLMYALPVLIKNINQNNNELDWQLVRKFFFVDNVSGFKRLSNFTNNKDDELSVLRYMKSLNIIINIQNTKDKNKIFPPLLIIEYAELTYEQIDKVTEVTLDYKIKFTLKDDNIDSYFMIIIGILSGLILILSGIKTWNYSKRHHTSFINIFVFIWFFIYTMNTIGSIIILCLVILCLYLFTFYKEETIPYILFSEDINEKVIKIFTATAFFSKLIEMFGFICQYWNIDIFFIDWEQPKTTYNQCKHDLPYMSINEFYIDKLSRSKFKQFQMSSEIITAKRKKIACELNKYNNSKNFNKYLNNKEKTNISTTNSISKMSAQIINKNSKFDNAPISIWRTCFIASQWLNLQTKRKINIKIQLLAVLCIFQIIRLYPWIFGIYTFSEDYNFILYFTICVLIYILTYCMQWLVFVIFYEQCVTNKMQEFINLCSIANISLFILPFNYYGFYIHGRSVHGFADTDLPTLINGFQMEKSNLCAHKGLIPGTTQQTFILYLTESFRVSFNKSLELMKIERNNFIKTYYSSTINWEYVFNSQLKIKEYLYKYIDHCITDEDYAIKEQHFFEKVFNIILSRNKEKSIFYIDNNYSFNQTLLYGNEWLFATFEISIFTFIIVLCNDCTLAIIITVLISMLLTVIVKQNGKRNLNKHTLLDKLYF